MLKDKIERLEADRDAAILARRAFVEEQTLIAELAPDLWRDTRKALASKCSEHPNQFRPFGVFQRDEAIIERADIHARLEVSFNPRSQRANYRCGASEGYLKVILAADREPLFTTAYNRQFTADEAAEFLLEALLDSIF